MKPATTAIPKSVRVGPLRYVVKLEDGAFLDEHNEGALSGEADHNTLTIRLMRRAPDAMYITFWHEVLHAIDALAGTGLSEEVIERFAPLLVGVLLDNGFIARERR